MIVLSRERNRAINLGGMVLTVVEIVDGQVRFTLEAVSDVSVRLDPDDEDGEASAGAVVGPPKKPPGILAAQVPALDQTAAD